MPMSKYNITLLTIPRGFKNYSILVCGLSGMGTPLSGVFDYRFFVIFDLDYFLSLNKGDSYMDKYTKSKVAQQFNRSSGISVSPEYKKSTEEIALAHAVAGNMDAFMLMTNTLAKVDADNNLLQIVAENQAQTAELSGLVAKVLGKLDKGKKK